MLRLSSGTGAGVFSLSLLADDNAFDDSAFFDTDPDGIDIPAGVRFFPEPGDFGNIHVAFGFSVGKDFFGHHFPVSHHRIVIEFDCFFGNDASLDTCRIQYHVFAAHVPGDFSEYDNRPPGLYVSCDFPVNFDVTLDFAIAGYVDLLANDCCSWRNKPGRGNDFRFIVFPEIECRFFVGVPDSCFRRGINRRSISCRLDGGIFFVVQAEIADEFFPCDSGILFFVLYFSIHV